MVSARLYEAVVGSAAPTFGRRWRRRRWRRRWRGPRRRWWRRRGRRGLLANRFGEAPTDQAAAESTASGGKPDLPVLRPATVAVVCCYPGNQSACRGAQECPGSDRQRPTGVTIHRGTTGERDDGYYNRGFSQHDASSLVGLIRCYQPITDGETIDQRSRRDPQTRPWTEERAVQKGPTNGPDQGSTTTVVPSFTRS